MDALRVVEAVLFSAGKPLRVADIARETGLTPQVVRRSIGDLRKEYEGRGSAIEIAKIDATYSMQLREEMLDHARPFIRTEVPEEALKTAAMIAYHQPILQSDLVRMLGSGVYDHVRSLRLIGLIRIRKVGHTLQLSTTRKFSEHFGIESSDREGIKRWMESRIRV